MISLIVRGTPAEHPYNLLSHAERVTTLAYEGWVQLIRRAAAHQLTPRHQPAAGLVVVSARFHSRHWEDLRLNDLAASIAEALTGIAYVRPAQISKMLLDKRPPLEPVGHFDEGAFITAWPADQVEQAFLDAIQALVSVSADLKKAEQEKAEQEKKEQEEEEEKGK